MAWYNFKEKIIRTGLLGPWWECREGNVVLIRCMDDKHLFNTIHYLRRRAKKAARIDNEAMFHGGIPDAMQAPSFCPVTWEQRVPRKYKLLMAEAERRKLDLVIKPQIYYRKQEQSKCPACESVVITPPMHQCEGESLPLIDKSICCWCEAELEFELHPSPAEHLVKVVADPKHDKTTEMCVWDQTWTSTGLQGTTDVIIKYRPDHKYEARVGLAMFGSVNNDAAVGANPFDPLFHDNYASGVGDSVEAAIEALREDCESMTKSLWAE